MLLKSPSPTLSWGPWSGISSGPSVEHNPLASLLVSPKICISTYPHPSSFLFCLYYLLSKPIIFTSLSSGHLFSQTSTSHVSSEFAPLPEVFARVSNPAPQDNATCLIIQCYILVPLIKHPQNLAPGVFLWFFQYFYIIPALSLVSRMFPPLADWLYLCWI